MRFALVGLSVFFCAVLSVCNADAGQHEKANSRGDVVVAWSVDEGYKVSIKIKGMQGNEIFRKDLKVDVSNVEVDFWDVNRDGYDDVVVKYKDEAGFNFDVFVNVNGYSFVDSLINLPPIYVETEFDVDDEGNAMPLGKLYLENVGLDSTPDIIAEKVVIDRNRYKRIVLKYNHKEKIYIIVDKEPE